MTWSDPTSIDQRPGVEFALSEFTRVADYIPSFVTASPRVRIFIQTAKADQAAAVAPGADKPLSSPAYESSDVDVVKIAHYGTILDEVIADVPGWADVVRSSFIDGLVQEENNQLLNGAGAGEDMVGLVDSATSSVTRDTTNERRVSAIFRAITKLRAEAFVRASIVILAVDDYQDLVLEEINLPSSTGQATAFVPDLANATPGTVFGVPILVTTALPAGTGLVADLAAGARLYWREMPRFQVHPAGGGLAEWKSNTTLVRAEERVALGVVRPDALCTVLAI